MSDVITAVPTALIGAKTYHLDQLDNELSASDPLVIEARQAISTTLTVHDLVSQMDLAARQLNVAHLAAADYNVIQNDIWQILSDLQVAVGHSDATMIVIGDQAGLIISLLADVFDYMTDGDVTLAIKKLKHCSECAGKLAQAAEAMAAEYDKMAGKAKTVVGTAQGTTAQEKARIADLAAQVAKFDSEIKSLKSLTDSYAITKTRLETLYNETKAQAETAEERAFVADLVGGIFSAVGSGLAAYASASTPRLSIGSDVVPMGKTIGEATPAAKATAASENKTIDVTKAPIAKPETAKTGDAKPAPAPAAKPGDATAAKPGDTTAKPAAKEAPTKEDTTKEDHVAEAQAASATAVGLAEQAGKVSDKASTSAAELRKLVADLLNQQFAIEDKNRTALADMARYASLMQSTNATQSAIEISVTSLGQSIAALSKVTAILTQAAIYWRGMEQACERLGDNGVFQKAIADLDDMTDAQRTREFTRPNFIRSAIQYSAGWRALKYIADDYRDELGKLGKDVMGYVGQHPSEAAARAQAITLAKALGIDVGDALKASTDQLDRISKMKDTLALVAPAPTPAPTPVTA